MSIVYLVATGEVVGGLETYTRHDQRPPLCDAEVLHTTTTEDLCDFLRQEGYAEGRYDEAEARSGEMTMRAMMGLAEPTPVAGLSTSEEGEFREWLKGIDSANITARNAWAARALLAKMRGEA